MKPIAVYALVLGTTMAALLNPISEARPSYFAQLESITLDSPVKLTEDFTLPGEFPDFVRPVQKSYHIYFENKSTSLLEVAVHYKTINDDWSTEGLVTLSPGEKRLMGKSGKKTYFYYAAPPNAAKKKALKHSFKFPIKAKSTHKLNFQKKEIWECYDTQVCYTFAVFR